MWPELNTLIPRELLHRVVLFAVAEPQNRIQKWILYTLATKMQNPMLANPTMHRFNNASKQLCAFLGIAGSGDVSSIMMSVVAQGPIQHQEQHKVPVPRPSCAEAIERIVDNCSLHTEPHVQ